MEKTKNATSDEERFIILYTLLEGEPKKAYSRHLATIDKLEALKDVWSSLRNNFFGYHEQNLLVDINMRSARSPVESMPKRLHTLIGDLCYCWDRAGREHATHLNNPSFLGKCADHLPAQFRQHYRDLALVRVGPPTFEGLMTFIIKVTTAVESEPGAWKDTSQNKKTKDNNNRSDTS